MTSENRLNTILSKLALSHKARRPADRESEDKIAIEIDAVRDDVFTLSDEYKEHSESLSRRVEMLSERISVLYPTLRAVHKGYVESSHKVGILEKNSNRLSAELANAHEELSIKEGQLSELTNRLETLLADHGELTQRLLAADNSLADHRNLHDELEAALAQERRKVAQLKDCESDLRARLAKRDTEFFEAQNRVGRLGNDLAEARFSIEAKQVMIDRLSESVAEEQAARAKAESLLIQARAEADALTEDIRIKTREAANAVKKYEAEIERLKTDWREERVKQEGLQSRVNVLDKLLAAQRTKESQINRHVAHLQKSMRQMLADKVDESAISIPDGLGEFPYLEEESVSAGEGATDDGAASQEIDVESRTEAGHVVQFRPMTSER